MTPPATSIALALRMRCPNCGGGKVMRSWLAMNRRCASCGLRFERGDEEEHEYWLGAYTLNFIATELVFAAALGIALFATWPDPPWRRLIYGGAVLMVVTPIALYPVSRALWLGIDLIFRPPEPDNFAP